MLSEKTSAIAIVFLLGLLFLAVIAVPSGFVRAAEAESYSVDVYVVCLNGVSAQSVENISDVMSGVMKASEVRKIVYCSDFNIYGEFYVDAHVYLVTDWIAYRLLVEFGSNLAIINAHGEVLPVPSGYAKEEWVDKIAYAMAYRNVTWAHTAGYPFSKVFYQDSGMEEWGVDGFKRLMSHINLGEAECTPPSGVSYAPRTTEADFQLHTSYEYMPHSMDIGMPLNGSYFKNVSIFSLYSYIRFETKHHSGAIVKFADSETSWNFGFYIHIGGGNTYHAPPPASSNRDFDCGYIAGAAAIWEESMKKAILKATYGAEQAIFDAEAQGRIEGLNDAVQLLQESRQNFLQINWAGSEGTALPQAKVAKSLAEKTSVNDFYETYGLGIVISCVLGVILIGFVVVRRKKWQK